MNITNIIWLFIPLCSILIALILWVILQQNTKYRLLKRINDSDDLIRKLSQENREKLLEQFADNKLQLQRTLAEFKEATQQSLHQHRTKFDERQLETLKILQDSLQKNMSSMRDETSQKLKEISGQVEKRLTEGFEKTTETFTDVVKRLALIDEAQKKITELSTNVVSLQEVLTDKRSRGAFGEVQLSAMIRNMLPEKAFALQHTLSNGKRVDCMIFLPQPTGNVAIDAKFPLESYRQMIDTKTSSANKTIARKQFTLDIKKHIQDISNKYIITGETSNGAMMFVPAEAVFAEIHANFPELVDTAHKANVWITSPTTTMAILTTARAVLKDEATRKQVHIIQEHLGKLSENFGRFEKRMNNLAQHINLAYKDVDEVHASAKKITAHFNKIEKVELEGSVNTN
ncbi:MAG: DNA recombination protein RmuC [Gammaproteobacteria bacterium]